MDSKERHELEQNDLASALTGAKDFWNSPWLVKYGNTILLVVMLLIAAVAVRMWANNRATAMEDRMWADLGNTTSPENYRVIASSYSDPRIKSLALLRAGDLLLEQATNGQTIITQGGPAAATQPVTTTTDPAADARNAVLFYEEVISFPDVNPLVRLNALLGAASANENLGKWDEARTYYEKLKAEAGEAYPILQTRATNRLAMLPRLKEPMRFAPDAPPAPPAGVQPPTGPAPLPGLGTIPLPPRIQPEPAPASQAPAATQPAVEP